MTTSTDNASAAFDWQAAYDRLQRAERIMQETDAPSPETIGQILRQRAHKYAAMATQAEQSFVEAIVFRCEDERYAIPLADGTAAIPIDSLTFVPGLPAFYLGLVGYRGAIYPVIDPRPLLTGRRQTKASFAHAILVRKEEGSIGFAATELNGVLRIPTAEIVDMTAEARGSRAISGIGPHNTYIIDAASLLLDIRLSVNDQPAVAAYNTGKTP